MPTSGPPEHPWLIPATHNRGNAPRPPATWRSFSFFVPVPPTNPPPPNEHHPRQERRRGHANPRRHHHSHHHQRRGPPLEDIAACRAVPNAADLFFSEDIGDIAAAKRGGADCSVLAECLEAALDRRELFGVWGGQLFINGKMLTVKRRRGRPRRSPVRRTRCRSCRFRCICRPPPRSGPPESLPTRWRGRPPTPPPHDPPTARPGVPHGPGDVDRAPAVAGTGGGSGNEDGDTRQPMPGVAISSFAVLGARSPRRPRSW